MKFIDSHCHINDIKFAKDLEAVISRALKSGINQIICVGTDLKSSEKAIEIANNYSNIYATCGVHPHDSKKTDKKYLQIIEEFSKQKKVVAIGEMGLDYFYDFSDHKTQKIIFREQLDLAHELNLPAIIHNRESDNDLYSIINKSKLRNGVIHCFASDLNFAKKLLKLGLHISFTGMITFVKNLTDIIKNIDINKIMIETDSPYLAPKPFRGKRNEPKNILHIANFIAEKRNIELKILANIITKTTQNFFNLPKI